MFGVLLFVFLSKKGELDISNRASDLTITKMCFSGVCKTKCRVVEASAACPASDFDFERIAFQINLKKIPPKVSERHWEWHTGQRQRRSSNLPTVLIVNAPPRPEKQRPPAHSREFGTTKVKRKRERERKSAVTSGVELQCHQDSQWHKHSQSPVFCEKVCVFSSFVWSHRRGVSLPSLAVPWGNSGWGGHGLMPSSVTDGRNLRALHGPRSQKDNFIYVTCSSSVSSHKWHFWIFFFFMSSGNGMWEMLAKALEENCSWTWWCSN